MSKEVFRRPMCGMYIPRKAVTLDCGIDLYTGEVLPSKTRQEMKDECDINVIMEKYDAVGGWPPPPDRPPTYMDCTEIPDFRASLDLVREASVAFMSLPAKVRREFDHDPVKFVEFAQDPENIAQMREWGLAAPEKVPDAPMRVEVVNAPAAPASPGGDAKPDKGGTQ